MFLPENHSPNFSSKSKSYNSTTNHHELGASNHSRDIVEHDVIGLKNMNNLPTPDAFEALQLSSER